jgi:hypothetical protein
MKYAYPLAIVLGDSMGETGSYTSPVWDNFIEYTNIDPSYRLEEFFIVERELALWNACKNEGCGTISFKTPQDLTLFLLRFS